MILFTEGPIRNNCKGSGFGKGQRANARYYDLESCKNAIFQYRVGVKQ